MFKTVSFALLAASLSVFAGSDISKIDRNFAVEKFDDANVVYRDALKAPFVLEGFPWREEGKPLRRIPDSIKPKDISGGVYALASHTAGGVIRFRTDSDIVVLRAVIENTKPNMGHMPTTGSSGFDVFADKNTYVKTVNPSHNMAEIPTPLVQKICGGKNGMRDYSVYLPLYNGVKSVEIGTSPNAKFEAPTPHKIGKPVVFYGSSITQGACASRPSNCHAALLSRAVDAPMINLGFSGNAKGEKRMAELIAGLDMAAFVYDYDYNAPNAEHLMRTHEPFFKIIRAAHPDLPVIMISRFSNAADARAAAVRKTYENAVAAGDKKVWFLDGRDLVRDVDYAIITVDGCHPNDLGFYFIYKNTLPALKAALGEK